jgi:hypothetical protein
LGHPSPSIVQHVLKNNDLPFDERSNSASVCDACQKGKMHQLPYTISSSVSKVPLELVLSDVWGPVPESIGRFKYYVSFIDDFSKFTWIYLIKHKFEVFQCFHDFHNLVERLFDRKILAMQTDWGGEYHKLNTFFQRIGISHHISCPHAHQQNGSAKCKHCHIVEVGLSLLAQGSMPLKFCDEAFRSAVYLINRTPSRVLQYETPLEKIFNTKPNYLSLRVFRCDCWPNLRPVNTRKLQFRSKQCTFLGYSQQHKGFKYLDVATGRVYTSHDVIFDENVFLFASLHSNAGARLWADINLLPSHLIEPFSTNHDGVCTIVANAPAGSSNDPTWEGLDSNVQVQNSEENGVEMHEISADEEQSFGVGHKLDLGAVQGTSVLDPVPGDLQARRELASESVIGMEEEAAVRGSPSTVVRVSAHGIPGSSAVAPQHTSQSWEGTGAEDQDVTGASLGHGSSTCDGSATFQQHW